MYITIQLSRFYPQAGINSIHPKASPNDCVASVPEGTQAVCIGMFSLNMMGSGLVDRLSC
jgi:hypothetical protein